MSNQGCADKIAESIIIPPTPAALSVIATEQKKEEPNLKVVIDVLKKDVGIYSAVLQIVNSPFMGVPNKVTSIDQAVMLLGLQKIASVARSVSVRANLGEPKGLPNFWETASEVAELCAQITQQLTGEEPADSYALGMFHSAGIPVMMQGFQDYPDILKKSIENTKYPLHWLEKARYGFSHHQVSSRLTQKWFLPKPLCHATLLQAVPTEALTGKINVGMDEKTATLLAILTLAKFISPAERLLWNIPGDRPVNQAALDHLEVNAADFVDVQNYCIDKISVGWE
jgi:HD-like signal output (HDOD) protein